MPAAPHIFGIRHHGPGSARSLVRALDAVKPDAVLIEGPPDADEVLALADHEEMVPPLAILVYAADDAKRAVYYPFAEFSPEWQAIKWALGHGVPVRFMDLPQSHRMALDIEAEKKAAEPPPVDPEDAGTKPPAVVPAWRGDPLRALAEAAGFDDGERWWEHAVEHRTGGPEVFAALTEAMAALREQGDPTRGDDQLREAWMRRTIREAQATAGNLAVVCGAWHAPALDVSAVKKADDDAKLKGLPKIKTTATWVPWTYDRLTAASGYGAGVQSPGWYEHLWRHNGDEQPHVLERWMTRVARLLREKDIDCSSAHVIEAVRLSHGLAGMRARPIPDLTDIADATRSVFCFDSDLPMRLIGRELLVGHRLGEVRDDTPMVPLQQHLTRLQKSLRFKPEALEKTIDFDLRNETDLARSRLLHQLRLLGVPWGTLKPGGGSGKGTFHELWQVRWEPEFAVRLIERGGWGNTVDAAASAYVRDQADHQEDLPRLAAMLGDVMLADLPEAVAAVMAKIESAAAVSADLNTLMDVVPPLAGVLRYGNVRQTDAGMVRHALDGLLPRVTVGLGAAVASLNDDAAREMERRIVATHAAVQLIQADQHLADWLAALVRVSDQPSVHGLLRGRCARLAFDAGRLDSDAAAERMSLALSRGTDPTAAAMWVEGFLRDSGLLLLHDAKLLGVLDDWVGGIATDVFDDMVPLLRRTFGTYPAAERRQLGQQLAAGGAKAAKPATAAATDVNEERARRVLPILATLLSA